MPILITQKENSRELLTDEFCLRWQALYDACGWATVFQSPVFIKTWHGIYQNVFDLVFVYEQTESGNLTGLLPLALEKSTGRLCAAGDFHAEYQTWLARQENGNSFVQKAFDAIKREFPGKKLQFLFLAPGTPLDWLQKKNNLSERAVRQTHPRPLIEVGDGEKFEESLRKKGNKSRLRQLRRYGEVRLERLETAEQFGAVFDEIEDYTKLRLSALHNFLPAADPNRKLLHQALMNLPGDLVHASILKVGDKIASAKFALRNRNEMLLCLTSMSPFLSAQSPSKLHILMLGREFARAGIPIFDLSPGGDYKDRFATHHDNAYSLNVFYDKNELRYYRSKRKAANFTKYNLEKLHVTKNNLFAFANKVRHKLKRANYLKLPQTVVKALGRKIYERRECRIYSFDVGRIKNLPEPKIMKRDSVADLLKFKPVESWQFTASQFHQVCLERFEDGNHSYTLAEGDTLLHYGWMVERQAVSYVFEVEQEFELLPNSAILYDYYTHPKARGKGLYKKALYQCLHDAAQVPDTEQVFIGVLADNKASRQIIEKVGFVYQGSLFKETKLGKVRKWQSWMKNNPQKSLEFSLEGSFGA
jgi:CelD/BcsL family acetyltransferase involved in cellulose biosynthesis/RimJ/RimL family protein N-acetyltransferase